MPPLVKVCVLGNTGVGKSKLIQQFVNNHYDDQYSPTPSGGQVHYSQTLLNGNLYQLKIVDMPAIKEFPPNSITEWEEHRQCLIRNAHAYVFVFDLNNPATFYYIKGKYSEIAKQKELISPPPSQNLVLRDQLFESRNMQNVPVWIVGNKADTCLNILATIRTHRHDHQHHQHLIHSVQSTTSPYEEIVPAFKDFANLVRKHWKCCYMECSAKYNWRVVPIFREIFKSLEASMQTADHHHHHHHHHSTGSKDSQYYASIKTISNETGRAAAVAGFSPADQPTTTTTNITANRTNACHIF